MVYWQGDAEVERPLCRYTEEVIAVHRDTTLSLLTDKFLQPTVATETIAAACAMFRLPFVSENLQPALAEQFMDVLCEVPVHRSLHDAVRGALVGLTSHSSGHLYHPLLQGARSNGLVLVFLSVLSFILLSLLISSSLFFFLPSSIFLSVFLLVRACVFCVFDLLLPLQISSPSRS